MLRFIKYFGFDVPSDRVGLLDGVEIVTRVVDAAAGTSDGVIEVFGVFERGGDTTERGRRKG